MGFHPIELRIQVLSLAAFGVETKAIAAGLDIPLRSVQKIIHRAKTRGFDPATDPRVKMEYVEDAERSGRPKKGKTAVSAESQAESTSGSGCVETESETLKPGTESQTVPEA